MPMPKLAAVAAFAASLALPLAATAQEATPVPPANAASPEPVVWQLQLLSGAEGDLLPEGRDYTLQFLPDGELLAQVDCNRGRGTWTATDAGIDIGPIATTRMACPPGSIDRQFLEAADAATAWTYADDALVLSGDTGATMTFAPALQGVTWVWQGFQGMDGTVVSPPDPADYTLAFLADDRLAVKADCNRGAGTWTVNGAEIDLTIDALTRAACPETSLSPVFVRDVDEVSSFVFRDGRLYLALPVDSGIHEFAARYDQPARPADEAAPAATPEA